jgi:hypothetical protein
VLLIGRIIAGTRIIAYDSNDSITACECKGIFLRRGPWRSHNPRACQKNDPGMLTLLELPIPYRGPIKQKIEEDRNYNTEHERPRYKRPKEGFQDEVRVRKTDFIPCNVRRGCAAAGYLDAEPQAKAVQGNNGPRIIDK